VILLSGDQTGESAGGESPGENPCGTDTKR
jgi:hypothetical protein